MNRPEIEQVVRNAKAMDDGRGWRPRSIHQSAQWRQMLKQAVAEGYLTPIRGSWGHRLTDTGKEVLAACQRHDEEVAAKLSAAGFDPQKRVSDMTDSEVVKLRTYLQSGAVRRPSHLTLVPQEFTMTGVY